MKDEPITRTGCIDAARGFSMQALVFGAPPHSIPVRLDHWIERPTPQYNDRSPNRTSTGPRPLPTFG
jgi:hypothetical protein